MRKVRPEEEPQGFAEFWALWMPVCRESDGKPKAREAYRKHILLGAQPQDIFDAARWHIRQREANNSLSHIQLVASWLNCERYEFEAIKEREYQARLQEQQDRRHQQADIIPMRRADPQPMSEEERERRERFVTQTRKMEG